MVRSSIIEPSHNEQLKKAFDGDNVALAFAADEAFVPFFSVLFSSLLEHASPDRNYDIIILQTDITAESMDTLRSMIKDRKNISLRFINVSSYLSSFESLFIHLHLKMETWYRLLLPQLLPDYEKILYLDCDMIAESDIAELFDTDVEGFLLAAVRDPDTAGLYNGFDPSRKKYTHKVMKMKDPANYFQAGTILFNLDEFRKTYTTEEMLEFAASQKWKLMDQDVLNCLCEDRVKYIDMSWNVMFDMLHYRKNGIIACAPKEIKEEYNEARKQPKIIHFAGPQKPTFSRRCDFGDRFWHYAAMSPFYERLVSERKKRAKNPCYGGVKRRINYFSTKFAAATIFQLYDLLLALLRFLKKNKKIVFNFALFFTIMLLTMIFVFRGQDMKGMFKTMGQMSIGCLIITIALSVLNVASEGIMIFFLFRKMGKKTNLLRCISYSFIGFFYSGLTPSATGGQPMQIYQMKKDGHPVSETTVMMLLIAFFNKLVVVIFAFTIFFTSRTVIQDSLGINYFLFFVGIVINGAIVVTLLLVMLFPQFIRFLMRKIIGLLFKMRILGRKKKDGSDGKSIEAFYEDIDGFIDRYREVVKFMLSHKSVFVVMLIVTFVQRMTIFLITCFIYMGLGLTGTPLLTIIIVQAAVTIACDMLPLPGAQGITEIVYSEAYANIFPGPTLGLSMIVSRGISFYLIFFMSLGVVVTISIQNRRKEILEAAAMNEKEERAG